MFFKDLDPGIILGKVQSRFIHFFFLNSSKKDIENRGKDKYL